jgi:hypothetical protein
MRACQVMDMNVIRNAAAVGGRIARAEYLEMGPLSECRLHSDFDQMGGMRGRLAASSGRISTRDIEGAR